MRSINADMRETITQTRALIEECKVALARTDIDIAQAANEPLPPFDPQIWFR
jgi:hypothetical protein